MVAINNGYRNIHRPTLAVVKPDQPMPCGPDPLAEKLTAALAELQNERELRRRAEQRVKELESPVNGPTINAVIRAVCAVWGCSEGALVSPSRGLAACRPRHAAFLLARRLCAMSYPEIGRRFKRDHTSVMHGADAAEHREATDPIYADKIARASALLSEGANG